MLFQIHKYVDMHDSSPSRPAGMLIGAGLHALQSTQDSVGSTSLGKATHPPLRAASTLSASHHDTIVKRRLKRRQRADDSTAPHCYLCEIR